MTRKYSNSLGCPKCGEIRLTARWCTGETSACLIFFASSSQLRVGHIHRICNNCSYEWYEAPVDYDPAKDARICAVCDTGQIGGAEANCGHYVCPDCALEDEPFTEACPLCYEKEVEVNVSIIGANDEGGDSSSSGAGSEDGRGLDDDVVPGPQRRSKEQEEVAGA